MKRSLTLFAIAGLFVLACGAQPATAQPPTIPMPTLAESRFGIDYVFPLQSTYQDEKWPMTLAQTGAKWVNFADVSWKALEPNPPQDGVHSYNWSELDNAVHLWQQYGFYITISLRLRDGWFAGPIKYRPEGMEIERSDRLPAEEHMDSYRAWIAALVERYDGDGEDDMPGLSYPILHYQVGNEYANPAFWTGAPDDYRILLEETHQAAHSASPNVQIISNGIRWNDLFHDDPNAELFEERFADFLENLPSDVWREAWQRGRYITELTVALADRYDILDAGGNGPFETASAGYMAWVQQELAKSGLTTTIWDMEARSEPRLTYNQTVHFHPELVIPDGEEILCAMKNKPSCAYDHDEAVAWYRAEQSRVLVKVFVTRFAAGFEKVFMGMPNDWDKMLAALAVDNPFIGLTDSDGAPWPAFYAFKLLVEKVDGFAQVEKMPAEPGVALYRFTFDDGRPAVWAAWLWEDEVRGMGDPLPTRQVRLDIPGPVTMYTIPTTGDTYETARLAGEEGIVVELSPEPVLFQEARSRIYLPLMLKAFESSSPTPTPTPEPGTCDPITLVDNSLYYEGGENECWHKEDLPSPQPWFEETIPPHVGSTTTPLYFGISVHIEPMSEYMDDFVYQRDRERLRRLAEIVAAHGGVLTIQTQTPFDDKAQQLGDTIFADLAAQGHEIALHFHEDAHIPDANNQPVEEWVTTLEEEIDLIEQLSGVEVRTWSGGNVYDNLYEAAEQVGLEVNINYKNPYTQQSDERFTVLTPWRPAGATSVEERTAHDPDGTVIYVPSGIFPAHCDKLEAFPRPYCYEAFDYVTVALRNSLDAVTEGNINAFYGTLHPGDFFGPGSDEQKLQIWDQWLTTVVDPLVADGRIQWATMSDIADAFMPWESSCGE